MIKPYGVERVVNVVHAQLNEDYISKDKYLRIIHTSADMRDERYKPAFDIARNYAKQLIDLVLCK